jgi:hypothetical protein
MVNYDMTLRYRSDSVIWRREGIRLERKGNKLRWLGERGREGRREGFSWSFFRPHVGESQGKGKTGSVVR